MAGCLQEIVPRYWCPAALVCVCMCIFYFLVIFLFPFLSVSQPLRPCTHTHAYSQHVCVYILGASSVFYVAICYFFNRIYIYNQCRWFCYCTRTLGKWKNCFDCFSPFRSPCTEPKLEIQAWANFIWLFI